MNKPERRKKKVLQNLPFHIFLWFSVVLITLPIILAVLYSLRPSGEYDNLPTWITRVTLEHYRTVLFEKGFIHYTANSLIATLSSIALALLLGLPAAYGFARFTFRTRNFLLNWILTTWMIPPIVAVIPIFLIMKSLAMFDKVSSLVILYGALDVALVVWVMVEFMKKIPLEVEEAAMLDGCTTPQILLSITIPMSKAGLLSTIILCFIFSWNEFLFAYIFTGPRARTIPVGTVEFVTPFGIQWGPMFATLSIMIIPPIIFVVLTRRYLIRGFVTLGGY
jgi:ABC-type glycerol-3-phosphate transport system permease component